MQSYRMTLIETNVNTWTGVIGSWLLTIWILSYASQLGTFWTANATVAACTVWSLIRGYFVRRLFNRLQVKHPNW